METMDALEATLLAVPMLRGASSEMPGQLPAVPWAVVGVPELDYLTTHGGGSDRKFTIYLFTGTAVERVGQRQLAELLDTEGENSVPAALLADRTLGGVIDDLRIVSSRPLGVREVGIIGYVGAMLIIDTIGAEG
jgi:hypothetical protein